MGWCDKKVATTPRWGCGQARMLRYGIENKHGLNDVVVEVVEKVVAEKGETFSCFFLSPWDLRRGGTGGQPCLFARSPVGFAGMRWLERPAAVRSGLLERAVYGLFCMQPLSR